MALLWADPFDMYATASNALTKNGYSAGTISAGNGRNGTNSVRNWNANRVLPSTYSTIILGAAWQWTAIAGLTTTFLQLKEGATIHVGIGVNGGKLCILRGTTIIATGTTVINNSQFYYIEVKATIADVGGSVEVRLNGNGSAEVSFSGDTRNAGTSGVIDTVTWIAVGTTSDVDDLYICDTTDESATYGNANNDFLGDVRVEYLPANGNGTTSNLVGSDGNSVDNYLLVDETALSEADYVESSTPGDKDTYAIANLTPTSGTVYAVFALLEAAKTDAGTRSLKTVVRSGGSDVDGSATHTLSTTSAYYVEKRAKPGGTSWSVSDVNSMEAGPKVNA